MTPKQTRLVPWFGSDAMIGDTAIDFGGMYHAAKLREIHRAHAAADTPYEIW